MSQRDTGRSPSTTPASYLRSVGRHLRWYGLAVVLSALALLLMMLLRPLMEHSIFFLFLAAVAITALYGGLRPGLVATLLSALAANFFFLKRYYSPISGMEEALRLAIFLATGLMVSWLAHSHKSADERLVESHKRVVVDASGALGVAERFQEQPRVPFDIDNGYRMYTSASIGIVAGNRGPPEKVVRTLRCTKPSARARHTA